MDKGEREKGGKKRVKMTETYHETRRQKVPGDSARFSAGTLDSDKVSVFHTPFIAKKILIGKPSTVDPQFLSL